LKDKNDNILLALDNCSSHEVASPGFVAKRGKD